MSKVIVITGASSGFGNLTARALARAGHTVYAGMRATDGRTAPRVAELVELSEAERIDVRGIELDVQDQSSVDAAIGRIVAEQGRQLQHRGGHPPFLAPYFVGKAAMDALAESYAAELIKFGIDTVIVVPGAFPVVPTTSPTPARRPTS